MTVNEMKDNIISKVNSLSTDALTLLSIIALHCASVPSMLAVLTGISDNMPSVDIFLFVYSGLFLIMLRSIIQKDMIVILLNSIGFAIQVILLSMIVFK